MTETRQWRKGWYADPKGPPDVQRWYDGKHWTEHTRESRSDSGLITWGWVTLALGLFFWPVFIAPFVIGIILAARGVAGHGAALIVLSVIGPIISLAILAGAIAG